SSGQVSHRMGARRARETEIPAAHQPGLPQHLLVHLAAGGENVADFGEKLDVGGRGLGLRCGFLFLDDLTTDVVHAFDHQENDPGQNQEVDDDGYEVPISQNGALLTRGFQRVGGNAGGERQEIVGKVETSEDSADDGHDDVVGQGLNDEAERTADDYADCQVHDASP